jgi:hypothetical protein
VKIEDRQRKFSCAGRIFFARKLEFPKESDKTIPADCYPVIFQAWLFPTGFSL